LFSEKDFRFILFLIFCLVDAAAGDNNARISPENNLDFYGYSQASPYSVIFISCFLCRREY
jgi:hypothetical protein